MKVTTVRLRQGQQLRAEIDQLIDEHDIKAGFILTCVGGISQASVRMAGATPEEQDIRSYKGDCEIVSLVGTISKNGCHLHISFSDGKGRVIGGHLKEATVRPTTELVIGIDEDVTYRRESDEDTGFAELVVADL